MSNNDTMKLIGERIKERRNQLNKMTQAQLAEKMGLSDRSAVSKWEKGTQAISVHDIPQLCSVLRCDVGYLFGEYDTPKKEITDLAELTCLSTQAANMLLQFSKPVHESECMEQEELCDSREENGYRRSFLNFFNRLLCNWHAFDLTQETADYWRYCEIQNNSDYPLERQDEIDLHQFKAEKQFRKFLERASFHAELDNEVIKRFDEKKKNPDNCDNSNFATSMYNGYYYE